MFHSYPDLQDGMSECASFVAAHHARAWPMCTTPTPHHTTPHHTTHHAAHPTHRHGDSLTSGWSQVLELVVVLYRQGVLPDTFTRALDGDGEVCVMCDGV
jgi:hypothetical protein